MAEQKYDAPEAKSNLLITKIHLPQLPLDWVARPRVSKKLEEALRYKLVLISAPAGYGKTTLVIEALRDFSQPVGWISLDASDNIPGNFWNYFILGLQSIIPGICQPALNALQSPQPPPAAWLMAAIINSIDRHEGDLILVLDDYHAIDSAVIHEPLSFLVEHLPPRFHLVIASRVDPPLPLARWRVKGEIAELRARDLSFTTTETSTFLQNAAGISLSGPDLALLESRTEGWAAGLKMAAFSLQGKQDISGYIRAFSGSNRYILDYLADEVLNQQPSDLKQFLLETSVLERLYGPLCNAVTERGDSQDILTRLERSNLFISALDDERRWYRYHQLFTAILHNQLTRDQPRQVSFLHHRASLWYEKEGLVEEAFSHALLSFDNERAAALLEKAAPQMLGQNQAIRLLEYSSRIPGPVILDSPWLCVCIAWAALTANKPEILTKMLSRAVESLSESPEKLSPYSRANLQRVKGHTLSLQSFIAQAQDNIPLAVQLSEEANRELPATGIDDLLARAVNMFSLSAHYQKTGEITKAVPLLEELIAAGRRADYHYAILAGQGGLAEVELQLSHFDKTRALCSEAIEQGTRWGGACPLPVTSLAYVILGQLNYEQNNLDAAGDNLKSGIDLGEAGYFWEPVIKGCLLLARLARAQGNFESAYEHLQQAEKAGPWITVPPEVHQIPAWKARLALFQGSIGSASNWAQQQELSLPLTKPPGYREEFNYLTLVRVKIAQRECRRLPEYLDEVIRKAEYQERSGTVIEALILKAEALGCLGESDRAVAALDRALSLAQTAGYVRTFADEGTSIAGLLQKIIVSGKHAAYASKLLRIIKAQLPAHSSGRETVSGLIEDLSERELEILRLIASGKSNQEISSSLFLAIGTVKKHTNNIYGKLGAGSRTQAVARARELGIL